MCFSAPRTGSTNRCKTVVNAPWHVTDSVHDRDPRRNASTVRRRPAAGGRGRTSIPPRDSPANIHHDCCGGIGRRPLSRALEAQARRRSPLSRLHALAALLLAVGAGLTQSWHTALFAAVAILGIRLLQDYFVTPTLLGGAVGMSPLVVLVSVLELESE